MKKNMVDPGVPLAPPDVKERYERNRKEAQQYGQEYAQFQSESAKENRLESPLRPETARLKDCYGGRMIF
jgi:hypothetical protein